MKLPQYFILGVIPVKFVEAPDGGMEILAYDRSKGQFVREAEFEPPVLFFSEVMKPGADVEEFDTEAEFEQAMANLEKELADG